MVKECREPEEYVKPGEGEVGRRGFSPRGTNIG